MCLKQSFREISTCNGAMKSLASCLRRAGREGTSADLSTYPGCTRCQEGAGQAAWQSEAVAAATKRDKVLRPILQKLAGQSLRAIAAELDRRGIKSWSGKPWNAVSVRNAMVRLGFQTKGGPS
jgi:hypothetical protein